MSLLCRLFRWMSMWYLRLRLLHQLWNVKLMGVWAVRQQTETRAEHLCPGLPALRAKLPNVLFYWVFVAIGDVSMYEGLPSRLSMTRDCSTSFILTLIHFTSYPFDCPDYECPEHITTTTATTTVATTVPSNDIHMLIFNPLRDNPNPLAHQIKVSLFFENTVPHESYNEVTLQTPPSYDQSRKYMCSFSLKDRMYLVGGMGH